MTASDPTQLPSDSPPAAPTPSSSVWARIKDHKIAQWTLAYAAAAYALLDGTKIIGEAFDWPHQVLRVVTVLLIVGVPVVVTLAWFHGHRALRRVSGQELTIMTVLLVAAAAVLWRFARSQPAAPIAVSTARAITVERPAAFAPPPHSIAVLPFANMSGDKDQEYFSDGLTEELLNALASINELQVAARTSAFSFKGKDADIGTIARKLNVGAVLEGSVRRSGHTVRVTTQLINAVTGFHLWSQTYDRDLRDVLKLQTDIANAVATALKAKLLDDLAERVEVGGTSNPGALDAYLRGLKVYWEHTDEKSRKQAMLDFAEAIRLDPNYARAYAVRSRLYGALARDFPADLSTRRAEMDQQRADAIRALELAPDLGHSHLAMALWNAYGGQDITNASNEFERALTLGPGDLPTLWYYSEFAAFLGRSEAAVAAARRAVAIDPLNFWSHSYLAGTFYYARRYADAIATAREALALRPNDPGQTESVGVYYYMLGDLQSAVDWCEKSSSYGCLTLVYNKLKRQPEADRALAHVVEELRDAFPFVYAQIYAQWGDRAKALGWLDTAMRLRDPGLIGLKVDPLMDPLRQEPRFQALMRELKFPE